MNIAKLMIVISMLFSATGLIFVVLFFCDSATYHWGMVAALVCIVLGNLINLLRMKMVGKKK